ncbi:hypothetical protein [Halalkalibacter flavus]|uniref:hypothetical protein n=1 Tax=Halalkalibacter flavus TaxID=3090668 RepID=UPI002FCBB9BD
MDFFVPLLATLIFGFFGVIGFQHAFKRYNPDENFLDIMSAYPTLFQVFGKLFLWITKKIFPEHIHIKVYRVAAFLFGLLMFGIIVLFWVVFNIEI